jgi:23S rRNA-/tRNA-specific pseudouridylate synthase
MYLPGGRREAKQTLQAEQPPMRLHAARLAFHHPIDRHKLEFTSQPTWS